MGRKGHTGSDIPLRQGCSGDLEQDDQEVPAVELQQGSSDDKGPLIFSLWNRRERYVILTVTAITTLLLPFTDTIYLPALQSIQEDFNTTAALTTASVSLYMFTVGIVVLFWGPLSDRYGRRLPFIITCGFFLAFTIAIYFSPSIEFLLVLRVLQAISVGAFGALGQGSVSDVFPPEQRGTAAGIFIVPVLVGPIIGPLIGGGLSQAFGWRSTFICLAILAFLAWLLIIFALPETHHWFKLQHVQKQDPALAATIAANSHVDPPIYLPPWAPLTLLTPWDVWPYAICALFYFGPVFICLTQLPYVIAVPPYSLSYAMIGLCYLPNAIGSFIGSITGGLLSDYVGTKHAAVLDARIMPGTVLSLLSGIPGFLIYGWALQFTGRLVVILLGTFLIGFASSVYLPCVFSFLTVRRQAQASAAAAGLQSLMFITSGILISLGSLTVEALGAGVVFSISCGLAVAISLPCLAMQVLALRKQAAREAAKGGVAMGAGAGAGGVAAQV